MKHTMSLCIVLACILILTSSLAYGATEVKWAGFRSSIYGAVEGVDAPFPGPEVWDKAGQALTANYGENTVPTFVWIVGTVDTDDAEGGKLMLEMKRPGPEPADVHFIDDDTISWGGGYTDHEAWLKYFDEHGMKVVLQVEPGHSDVLGAMKAIMEAWGHHESVIGFGVDIEWYKNSHDGAGEATVDGETMLAWINALHEYKADTLLMVKHWDANNLAGASLEAFPNEIRPYLVFCCDSQGIGSLEAFVEEMAAFAAAYEDGENSAPIWYQIGYMYDWWDTPPWAPENGPWFHTLKEGWEEGQEGIPAEERGLLPKIIGGALAEAVSPNQEIGIIWVDFTMRTLYPEIFSAK